MRKGFGKKGECRGQDNHDMCGFENHVKRLPLGETPQGDPEAGVFWAKGLDPAGKGRKLLLHGPYTGMLLW